MEQRNDKKNTVSCLLVLCFVMTLLLTALHSQFMQTHAQEPKQLQELAQTPVDMFTTVFIGSSSTKEIAGRMVTPRGYRP